MENNIKTEKSFRDFIYREKCFEKLYLFQVKELFTCFGTRSRILLKPENHILNKCKQIP